MKNIKSLLACLFVLVVTISILFNINKWRTCEDLQWDSSSYHLYLPATFIYKDLFHLNFYKNIDSIYKPSGSTLNYAIYFHESTNRKHIKYSCGVAIFEFPLFLVAHAYCLNSSFYSDDGYSPPFQLAVSFSTLLFCFWGLLILRLFLLNYFNDTVVALTILILYFGTNLFEYTAFEPGMSHVYLFFLFAVVLNSTHSWYKHPTYKNSILLGCSIGLAALIRPTEVLILIIPLTWGLLDFRKNFKLIVNSYKKIMVAILIALLIVSIQLIYWKLTTSNWIYYSYEKEGFNFNDPNILEGLFSYRKGWFVYTPIALIAFIGSFNLFKNKKTRFYCLPLFMYFIPTIYIVFSWWMWFYGGSFGCRALLETLALLALPIACLIQDVLNCKNYYKISAFFLIIFLSCSLNLFQSWQYKRGILHYDSMNKNYYWRIFLKTSSSDEDKKLLN